MTTEQEIVDKWFSRYQDGEIDYVDKAMLIVAKEVKKGIAEQIFKELDYIMSIPDEQEMYHAFFELKQKYCGEK